MKHLCLIVISVLYFSIKPYAQDTIRVPLDYGTIQMGLDSSVENSVVLIAPGTYFENVVWPANIKGIDLIGERGSDSTIIDGSASGRVLRKEQYSDPNSIIQGLTLQNGKSSEAAGLLIDGRGTALYDVVVRSNETSGKIHCDGGGARLESYSGVIRNCRFTGNRGSGGWTSYGAGISIELSGNLEMYDVVIQGNRSTGGNSSSSAGMTIDGFSNSITMTNVRVLGNRNVHDVYGFTPGASIGAKNVTIDSCVFAGNSNSGATSSVGGGLSLRASNGVIKNSSIYSNFSEKGSGIRFYNDDNNVTITNTTIANNGGNSTIIADGESGQYNFENCLIVDNNGVGIAEETPFNESGSVVMLNHVTIANNAQSIIAKKGFFQITNSILWNYISDNGKEIIVTAGAWIIVKSSIVRNGYQGSLILDEDPFLDPVTFEPGYLSKAVDFANPVWSPTSSINNVLRPTPANTLPDIGAFESNQARSYVDAIFFYDDNKNGVKDSVDFNLTIGGINYNDILFPNIKEEGISLELPKGMQAIKYADPLHTYWELTTDTVEILDVVDSIFYKEVLFGLSPKNDSTNVETHIDMDPFRCGETISGSISVYNEFSVIGNSYLWLEIDDRIESIFFDIDPDVSMTGHLFGWSLSNLKSTFTEKFGYSLTVPEITDQNQLGNEYLFKTWCEGFEESSKYIYRPQLRCSYDPNDKMVTPKEIDTTNLREASMTYTIRFQNTGNDYAKDIVIIDTLSDNVIPETFQYINSSHPNHLVVTREADKVIKFHFTDIFLIDSLSDSELSNGFVSFRISPKSDLEINAEINNTAYIIFDNNPPIVTNTAKTEIRTETSTGTADISSDMLSFYPNPTEGVIHFDQSIDRVDVYTVNGEMVSQYRNCFSINIGSLEPGVYMLNLKKGEQYVSRKVVKQ